MGLVLAEDTKNNINRLYATDHLLFCYPGEIQMAKFLGLTQLLIGFVGILIALTSSIHILRMTCVVYSIYGLSVSVLFKNSQDYWRSDSSDFFLTIGLLSLAMVGI